MDASAGLALVPLVELESITGTVAEKFVTDPNRTWWWDALRVPHDTIESGEDDELELLKSLITDEKRSLVLVATDDEHPPWVGVRGSLSDLVGMLRELPMFEYFLVDDSVEWIVFDTHHNALIVARIKDAGVH